MNEEREYDKQRDIEKHIAKIKADIEAKKKWHQPITDEDRAVHQMYLEHMKNVPPSFWGQLYSITDECIGWVIKIMCLHVIMLELYPEIKSLIRWKKQDLLQQKVNLLMHL